MDFALNKNTRRFHLSENQNLLEKQRLFQLLMDLSVNILFIMFLNIASL
jgi:hypothetical protein